MRVNPEADEEYQEYLKQNPDGSLFDFLLAKAITVMQTGNLDGLKKKKENKDD